MSRFAFEVLRPSSVVPTGKPPAQTFEEVWSLIPQDHPRRLWRFLDVDGGLFIKGQRVAWRPRPRVARAADRMRAEAERLQRLIARGLPFPEPLAWGHERLAGISTRSLLVLRLLPGVVDLEEFLLLGHETSGDLGDKAELSRLAARASRRHERPRATGTLEQTDPRQRLLALEAVGAAVRQLHEAGAIHRDLSPRNVMLRFGAGPRPEVFFIDCPRAVIDPAPWTRGPLRRAELFRLARGLLRLGGRPHEAACLLRAAGAARAARIVQLARLQGHAPRRPQRARLWVLTGALLGLPPAAGEQGALARDGSGEGLRVIADVDGAERLAGAPVGAGAARTGDPR